MYVYIYIYIYIVCLQVIFGNAITLPKLTKSGEEIARQGETWLCSSEEGRCVC